MKHDRREFITIGTLGLAALATPGAAQPADRPEPRQGGPFMKGPVFNQDDSEFCSTRSADQMSVQAIEDWVDSLQRAGVGTLITCVCAQTTNYPSKVWEPRWARYDPQGPDDQPVLKHLPADRIANTRRWLEAEMKLADLGINFHQVAYDRCRKHGMGAWASIRMNDLHDCDMPDSPLLSTFYKSQRDAGVCRVPYRMSGWTDRALDWERQEVREYFYKLVCELLGTLDLDGLELDWMRFGYHFQPGRELQGGKLLTEWVGQVRQECQKAAQRLGHPVRLGVRVPSRPDTARNLGMDAVAWAREELVDLVVPTPFWASCEFDMPMRTWHELLRGTQALLAGGIEVRYHPHPGAAAGMMSAQLAAGAATAVLAGRADMVYLFNYFGSGHGLSQTWGQDTYDRVLGAMGDLASLSALPRRHAVTYRDVRAPGEPDDNPLPATGNWCEFRLQTGPRPDGRQVSVLIETPKPEGEQAAPPAVRVNGVPCRLSETQDPKTFIYAVPASAFADEAHVLQVAPASGTSITVTRVEFAVQ